MPGTIDLSSNTLAQGLHVTLGALAVALPGWLWGNKAALIGGIVAFVFASIKEAWWDPKYETVETAGSGWLDWSMYLVGIAAAGLLYGLVQVL